jgi:nucleoside phosphorylase
MKILVTFALGIEFAAWRRQHQFHELQREPFPLYAADIGGSTIKVLLTGMGTSAARRAACWALRSPADLCISSGFAGALRGTLRVADVLAARVVHRAEQELAVASDRALLDAACEAGACYVDRFLTSESLVVSAEQKAELSSSGDAVEMESYFVLAEASRRGVRAIAVRAVSEAACTPLPYDFMRSCDGRGRIRLGALAAQILRQPGRVPHLIRLGRDCRMAGRRLAFFLDGYLELLQTRVALSYSEMMAAL